MKRILDFVSKLLQTANHDFCPNANKYVYWMKKPIGWVVAGVFFSVLIGLFVGPQGFVLAFAFVTLMVLGLVWPWLSIKGVECSLLMPGGQMKENEAAEVIFRVRNYWPIPVFGMIVEGDFLQEIIPSEELIAFSLKRVPALSDTEFPLTITPRRRGMLPSGEIRIKNGFPFGLTDVSSPVEKVDQTLVWPQCEPLAGSPPAEGSLFNLVGAMSDRSGNDGETIGVRSYREGDRLRNIHWAQTVRSQQLMVRERQTPSSTVATVLLDLNGDHHVGSGINNSFEWAIRIAASICYQLHLNQSSVRLVCSGLAAGERHVAVNQRGIDNVMDFLAGLPTLDMQRNRKSSGLRNTKEEYWSNSRQTFFVCTNLSSFGVLADGDVEPIMIDLGGFSDQWDPAPRQELTAAASARRNRSFFTITDPQHAAEQLALAWKRSFGNAVG